MPIGLLATLGDVDFTVPPKGGQALVYSAATSMWEPKTIAADGYSKAEVDTKIGAAVTGMVHGESIRAIAGNPPATPVEGDIYLIGGSPSGAWAGHANQLAVWQAGAWTFVTPNNGETHYVEDSNSNWHYNGTGWVKVAEMGLKMTVMTEAEYNALGAKDATTLYLLT